MNQAVEEYFIAEENTFIPEYQPETKHFKTISSLEDAEAYLNQVWRHVASVSVV